MDRRIRYNEKAKLKVMKKNTYEIVSTLALVLFLIFTFSTQYSSHGRLFGGLAIVTAAGLFLAYLRVLPKRAPTNEKTAPQPSVTVLTPITDAEPSELDPQRRDFSRIYDLNQPGLFLGDDEYVPDIRVVSQFLQVKVAPYPAIDPVNIITKVVEKLCAASKEPRFEFVLAPDGSFKIRQISAKLLADEPTVVDEEPVKESPLIVH